MYEVVKMHSSPSLESDRPWGDLPLNRPNAITVSKLVSNATVLVLTLFFAIPMLWLVLASIDQTASFQFKMPVPTINHYITAVEAENLNALANSLILSGIAMVVGTTAAFMAAYVFSRHHIPFKNPLMLTVLFLSGIPISILIVPTYKMFAILGWFSIFPTGVLLGVTGLPFQIYQLKNFIDAIPSELEEAAFMERASSFQILRLVIFPLTKPGLASAAIFGFVNAWGNFLIPIVLLSDVDQQPAPVRLYGFMGSTSVNYGAVAAYSIVYSIPVLVLFLSMSRQFKAGFSLGGAVK
ncbi:MULTISPECIES: carbohydrate ABC transporter permease [unclassified Mesorhizobium]|uniref:carbohydrate ABC transporter permease n=1 Tax=unclassified Mesorhizobium TaxID=325217 RepID=UPI001FCA61B1|nr:MULTISPECIES: carbohydrate ABC transporter permease [unclassified Mesorhizobium]